MRIDVLSRHHNLKSKMHIIHDEYLLENASQTEFVIRLLMLENLSSSQKALVAPDIIWCLTLLDDGQFCTFFNYHD